MEAEALAQPETQDVEGEEIEGERAEFVRLKAKWHELDAKCRLANPRTPEEEAENGKLCEAVEAAMMQAMMADTSDFNSILDKLNLLEAETLDEKLTGDRRNSRFLKMFAAIKCDLIAYNATVEPIRY